MPAKKRGLVALADREQVGVGVLVPRSQTVAYPQSPGSCTRKPEKNRAHLLQETAHSASPKGHGFHTGDEGWETPKFKADTQ